MANTQATRFNAIIDNLDVVNPNGDIAAIDDGSDGGVELIDDNARLNINQGEAVTAPGEGDTAVSSGNNVEIDNSGEKEHSTE